MTLTATQISQMNKMNRAAQNAAMGTLLASVESTASQVSSAFASGSYLAVTADASASTIAIVTGTTGAIGHLVQVYTSGSLISDTYVVNSGSALYITSGSDVTAVPPAIAAGDKVQWVVF